MKIAILTENRKCDNNCINEDGLSIYIETNNNKLLLDSGITDAFLKNAKTLGINLDEVDTIVLSHGHWDHGNGLKYINAKKVLILHPECYNERYSLKRNMEFAGINETREELLEKFALIETREPYKIFENVYFLGQINRKFEVPVKNLPTVLKDEKTDYLYDDCGGITIKTEKGIVVFSSCSHSGIDNIIEQAKQITGENRVIAVIGGFHLKEINSYTDQVIQYFKDNNVQSAYMGHCTSDEVIDYFKEQLSGITEVKKLFAGAKIEID